MPELISELPDDIRKIAEERINNPVYRGIYRSTDTLARAFSWHKTPEGHELWKGVSTETPSKQAAYDAFRAFHNPLRVDVLQADDKAKSDDDVLVPCIHPHDKELLDIVIPIENSSFHQICQHNGNLCVAYKQNGVQVRIGLTKDAIWAGMKYEQWWLNVRIDPSILKEIINWVELYL